MASSCAGVVNSPSLEVFREFVDVVRSGLCGCGLVSVIGGRWTT